jgi:hypothetical protein
VGRHQEGLDALRQGIEHLRFAFDKEPHNASFRGVLSNWYHCQAQRLRVRGQLTRSAEVTLERRKLYPDSGKELFRAACELGLTLKAMSLEPARDTQQEEARRRYADQAIEDLRQAMKREPSLRPSLATHPELEALRDQPRFQALIQGTDAK